jgi:UBX domain-containing protein 1
MPGGFPATSSTVPVSTSVPVNVVSVDDSLPITQVQIRLGDGTRLVSRFNVTHTIGDVRRFVRSARNEARDFILQTNMPTKVLDDDAKTLKDAGLLNAVIVQRYV